MEANSRVTLPLTPEMLAAAYDYLLATPPFSGWNLPDSEDVKFIVNRNLKKKFAQYQWDGERHTIAISEASVGHSCTLIEALAHETIHLLLEERGWESRGNEGVHNAAFRKLAAQVCKIHGFDPKAFY